MSDDFSSRSGLIAGGNWIVDHVKLLDGWPPQDALANILSESWGNGGSPYNILKNLAKLGARFPLLGIGLVGDDLDGARILADCQQHGIDTAQLRKTKQAMTSYSDVLTDSTTGRRTFFHHRGANALLVPDHFDFSSTNAKIFHLGYLLLLDKLDEPNRSDGERPHVVSVFRRAAAAGLITSLDCVSENSGRFKTTVEPVLSEVDVFFANDFEAERITGIPLRVDPNGPINRHKVEEAARALLRMGVRRWVVLHFPEAAFALGVEAGASYWQPSLNVPNSAIKGAAGAGDAFASGVLFGIHQDWSLAESLRFGVCVAACSLFSPTCSDGILAMDSCLNLERAFGYRSLPS